MAAKVVLLDIEGTVCSISFVKDVLFPYALRVLPDTLKTQWDSPQFAQYRNAFPAEYASSQDAFAAHFTDLVRRDVKAPYLKTLQGYLWKSGYDAGELRVPLFADVAPKLSSWHAAGKRIVIFSSGSVDAQKLLFGHTDAAAPASDLNPLITDYFDTVNAGPKMEAASYLKIAAAHPDHPVGDWLFLSDNVMEVEAAKEAGMQSFVVDRPGNAELSAEARSQHRVITSFDELGDLEA